MRAPTAIDIRNLSLTFQTGDGPVYALADANLTIAKGEFVSFIGPSGCGKTTLLRVIADLEQPTSGSITVNGLAPRDARLKRQYGYVFQAPALYPWRTVEANVMLPLEVFGLPKAERRERARKHLDLVRLSGFANKYPWQLSGGMQQRVSIARALSFEPELLLMDEPFGALDAMTRQGLQDEMLALVASTGATVVFVTHDLEEAIYLGDRVVGLLPHPGRVGLELTIDLPRPRDQLATREHPEFLRLRRALFDFIKASE